MTTVADLVAKLGFKVDDSGFNKFKNSLQAFQSIVREGIKDLKEYAKQAEKISKAFQNAYLPTRAQAEARFKADTYAIRARAYAQRVRARNLPETLAIRRMNAEIRDRQTTLKEAGLRGSGTTGGNALLSVIGALSGGFSGLATAIGSAVAGPIGAAFGAVASKIVSGIVSAIGWLWGQIKSGLRYAMAFRDYRSFTGRSHNELRGLMGMAQRTTSMTPQDIIRDATQMGQQYWDMWFGGGNPAIWQTLGVMPTTNGKANLQNLLGAIYSHTGGLKNRGLALSLLKQAGLSEDYMNILDHWQEYVAGGGEKDFAGYTDEEIRNLEEANKSLRKFSDSLDNVRVYFVDALLKSGLQDALKSIANYLLGIISAFRTGKIHDLSSLTRHIFAFDQMELSGALGRYVSRSEMKNKLTEEINKQLGLDKDAGRMRRMAATLFSGDNYSDIVSRAEESMMEGYRSQVKNVTYNNNFEMNGRPADEAVNMATNVLSREEIMSRGLSSAEATMAANG